MPKKSLYVSDETDKIVACRNGESFSGRVGYLLKLGASIAENAAPALALGEWLAIVNALNGHSPNYDHAPPALLRAAWHCLYDTRMECAEQWGVDSVDLAQRLTAMPLSAQAAVFEVAQRFWTRPDVVSAASNYRAALVALGAKVAPKVAAGKV